VIDTEEVPAAPATEQDASTAVRAPVAGLVEAALLLDIVVVLCLIRTFVPIPGFQGVVRLVAPAPYVLLSLRRGVRTGILATVGGFVVLSALVGPVFGTQILVYGLLGTVYAGAARLRLPYLVALALGALIYGGYIAVLTVGVPLMLGVLNLHISAGDLINKIRDQLQSVGHAIGSLHLGPIAVHNLPITPMRLLFHWTLAHWLAALVAIVVIYGVVNSWAFLFVTREILARVDHDVRVDPQGQRIDFYPPTQF
jgi:hypothetical protein